MIAFIMHCSNINAGLELEEWLSTLNWFHFDTNPGSELL